MRKLETVTDNIEVITCDFCPKEQRIRQVGGIKHCKICEKDVCKDCTERVDFELSLLEPYFYSDYPDYICKRCWGMGENIRVAIMAARDAAEETESQLLEKWGQLVKEVSI